MVSLAGWMSSASDVGFRGFRLQRTAAQALPIATSTDIIWQNPVLDTAAFFNVSTPTIVTVPPNVRVMQFYFRWVTDTEPNQFIDCIINSDLQGDIARAAYDTNSRLMGDISTGPIPVDVGEEIKVICNPTIATNLLQNVSSAFSGQVL